MPTDDYNKDLNQTTPELDYFKCSHFNKSETPQHQCEPFAKRVIQSPENFLLFPMVNPQIYTLPPGICHHFLGSGMLTIILWEGSEMCLYTRWKYLAKLDKIYSLVTSERFQSQSGPPSAVWHGHSPARHNGIKIFIFCVRVKAYASESIYMDAL